MRFARDIKDLSISMEALARIQGSEEYYSRIRELLDDRILRMEEQVHAERYVIATPKPETTDDEIPF